MILAHSREVWPQAGPSRSSGAAAQGYLYSIMPSGRKSSSGETNPWAASVVVKGRGGWACWSGWQRPRRDFPGPRAHFFSGFTPVCSTMTLSSIVAGRVEGWYREILESSVKVRTRHCELFEGDSFQDILCLYDKGHQMPCLRELHSNKTFQCPWFVPGWFTASSCWGQ